MKFGKYKEKIFDQYKEEYDFKVKHLESQIKYYKSGLVKKEMNNEEKEEIDFLTSLFTKEKNKIFEEKKYYDVFLGRLLEIQSNILLRIDRKKSNNK